MKDLSYLTDSYDEKIEQIRALNPDLSFVFITDMHNRMNEFARDDLHMNYPYGVECAADAIDSIQYILDRVPNIRCVVCGGDIGNDYHPDPKTVRASYREVMDAFYRLSVPTHCCIGNHDPATATFYLDHVPGVCYHVSPAEMHEICMKCNPTDKNYYYTDFEGTDYRFVFLNDTDGPAAINEEGQYVYPWDMMISNEQAEWFEKVALATERRIIVFSHAPLHNAGIFGTEGLPLGIKPYDDTVGAPRVYEAIRKSPNVLATFAGHVHYDNIYYDDRLLTVTTLCSLVQEWVPGVPKRRPGTPTETAFDVVSFVGNVAYLTRFGAGADRVGHMLKAYKV